MPSIVGDYDIHTKTDVLVYIRKTLQGITESMDNDARYNSIVLIFTLIDTHLDLIISKQSLMFAVIDKLKQFNVSDNVYENQIYWQFAHLTEQIQGRADFMGTLPDYADTHGQSDEYCTQVHDTAGPPNPPHQPNMQPTPNPPK